MRLLAALALTAVHRWGNLGESVVSAGRFLHGCDVRTAVREDITGPKINGLGLEGAFV